MTVIPIFVMFGDDCPALAASNTSLEILMFILCALTEENHDDYIQAHIR